MTEAQTIPEDIRKAAYDLGAAIRHHIAVSEVELIQHDATVDDMIAMVILAERERCAALVEEMLKDPRFTGDMRAKLGLMIAARAVRRGRHLTDSERLENVLLWAQGEGDAA